MEDLTGKKFGRLIVVSFDHKGKNYAPYWKCRCECGGEKIVQGRHLKGGRIQSCGCIKKEQLSQWSKEHGSARNRKRYGYELGEAAAKKVFRGYQAGAKVRGLEFSLSYEQALALFNGPCYYCGSPPSNKCEDKKLYGTFEYNGIDRYNNMTGYTSENSVSCCWRCNRAKGDWSAESFRAWIRQVYAYMVGVV